ncbi:MAG: hypothetical protein ACKOFW_02335, partial [Planctomycetaceae bacterium]
MTRPVPPDSSPDEPLKSAPLVPLADGSGTSSSVHVAAGPAAIAARKGPWLPANRRRRWLFLLGYLLFCYLLAWLGIHTFWYLSAAVPFHQRPTLGDQYFPGIRLQGLRDHTPRHNDGVFDLLLLGGSVIHREWGTVEAELRNRLERARPGRFRLYNLSQPGFTSRDSLLAYRLLDQCEFDLVLVYDGINDVRLNCCPPELFADDYGHAPRYAALRGDLTRRAQGVWQIAKQGLTTDLQWGTGDPVLLDHARQPQTPRTLRANYAGLLELAEQRGDPVLLLTYAWHLPADYTLEKFSNHELDYARDAPARCAAELWARPADVNNILTLQNAEIRDLAKQHPRASLYDLAEHLPRTGGNFVDPCHLTPAGCAKFVELIWPEVEQRVGR